MSALHFCFRMKFFPLSSPAHFSLSSTLFLVDLLNPASTLLHAVDTHCETHTCGLHQQIRASSGFQLSSTRRNICRQGGDRERIRLEHLFPYLHSFQLIDLAQHLVGATFSRFQDLLPAFIPSDLV